MQQNYDAQLFVAEDDPDDQLLIRDAIDASCSEKVVARFFDDGCDLMEYLNEDGPDRVRPRLVVLDLNMPNKDGRAALREIKADPALREIPVVILTTSRSDADRHFCQQHGALAYYCKPNNIHELEEIFGSLCSTYL